MYSRLAGHAKREFLTQRARIERANNAVDALGVPNAIWVISADDVPCRVIRAGRSNQDATSSAGGVEALPRQYRIAFPRDTEVGADYRVIVSGVTYSVVGVETALTDKFFVTVLVVRR